jgi:hypothetical protein
MKVTVTFEISDEAVREICECSVERVINTSMTIAREKHYEDLKDVNISDWQAGKPIVVTMWNAVRDAIFRVNHGSKEVGGPWVLNRGREE